MKSDIFDYLKKLGLTSKATRTLYSSTTRDVDDLKVWKDEKSGVIYIDEFYTGDETYIDGSYREDNILKLNAGKPVYEKATNAERQFKSNLKFVAGKRIADFGCGNGDFLRLVKPYCSYVIGIEIRQSYLDLLRKDNINCTNNLSAIEDNSLDVIFSCHVINQLPNPLNTLIELKKKLVSGGLLIVEVVHANDFLLSVLENEDYKKFTLCSLHLVLHTRESLALTLKEVGFSNVQIEGVQRYPLSNHLNWLAKGKAGGHKTSLSIIDSNQLSNAYADVLAKINATDTLVAIAKLG